MTALRPGDDPYRILGVLRGADLDQIKSAHRRLAKRFHPDRSSGDEQRFLAVQEAYQLLSDPKRRLEWDREHAPVPSWGSQPGGATGTRGPVRSRTPRTAPGARGRNSARPGRTMRPPGQRTATWSAAHVPWWEDFRPRTASADGSAEPEEAAGDRAKRARRGSRSGRATGPAATGPAADPAATDRVRGAAAEPFDLDAHSRSSGAAWSMAARRHFRRGDRDLPSRGAWRYRGTQVVTGAEARKVAADESTRGTPAPPAPDEDKVEPGS